MNTFYGSLLALCLLLQGVGGNGGFGGRAGIGGGPASGANTFTLLHQYHSSCTSANPCTITPDNALTSGNLVVLQVSNYSGNPDYVVSVSGGGTWTVPTGGNYQLANGCCGSVSTAYTLLSSATSSISATFTDSSHYNYIISEYSVSGTPALDTGGTHFDSVAGTSLSGISLTLGSSSDLILQSSVGGSSTPTAVTLLTNTNFFSFSGFGDLINTSNNTAPVWTFTSQTAVVNAIAFK